MNDPMVGIMLFLLLKVSKTLADKGGLTESMIVDFYQIIFDGFDGHVFGFRVLDFVFVPNG